MSEPTDDPIEALDAMSKSLSESRASLQAAVAKVEDESVRQATAGSLEEWKNFQSQVNAARDSEIAQKAAAAKREAEIQAARAERLAQREEQQRKSLLETINSLQAQADKSAKAIPNPDWGLQMREELLSRFGLKTDKASPAATAPSREFREWIEESRSPLGETGADVEKPGEKIGGLFGKSLGERLEKAADDFRKAPESANPSISDSIDSLSWRDWLFRSTQL